jgi:signal peptidase I
VLACWSKPPNIVNILWLNNGMETDGKASQSPGWLRKVVIGRNPRLTLMRIVILVALVFLGREFVLLPIKVRGPSMLPTYSDGGINFVNRLAYLRSLPKRGDVVAIRTSGPSIMFMKRVIGLPGETVAFHEGKVLINGRVLDEPYLNVESVCDWEQAPIRLGPDEFFVVGDNRTMPQINHSYGVASRDRIVGKIFLCKNLFASSSSLP